MAALYYRLTNTTDPEERLEDACLWKAMHDQYGDGITLLPDGARAPREGMMFGRTRHFEPFAALAAGPNLDYWRDPGFLAGISREFHLCDLEEAEERVRLLHESGRDAFVKACEQKLMTLRIPVGESFGAAIGDMVWSFIDKPDSLLVQEYVAMRNERRFVVIDRKIVTHSPVAWHLTPLSRAHAIEGAGLPIDDLHYDSPRVTTARFDPHLTRRMIAHVERVAAGMSRPHAIVDVAELCDKRIETIEFNPCQPGMFGLYACDPRAIAEASQALLPDDLLREVERRRAEEDPFPVPEEETAGRPAMARFPHLFADPGAVSSEVSRAIADLDFEDEPTGP
ncbi:hypothetical protein [Defluviimonas salinarum]|uniref:ATP-grasp domain-containing protein n=1 Tax=Defluviimonas salinarum TaxID=2992147 RepID=A0ABT3J5L2_9RHOB|nr:hypothetical protein [Defluviimonas salinarum]MCW3782986.1 hypothetical protein [Defluviimonas salinarum]